MKTFSIFFILLCSTSVFAQSKLSAGVGINQQFLKSDSGASYEVFVSYRVHSDIAINLIGTVANMETDETNIKYNINKYAVVATYDFAKSERVKLESIFGFSYVNFDDVLELKKNDALGIDLGVQTTFGLQRKLNYGFKLVSTYTHIAPGSLLSAGVFAKFNF